MSKQQDDRSDGADPSTDGRSAAGKVVTERVTSVVGTTVGGALATVDNLGGFLREQRTQARMSLRQLADAAGVSNPYLSQVERGLRRPSAEVLQQIAHGLRISAEALYVRAGLLDERAPSEVPAAIAADPRLSERHKRVLMDVYTSFVAEQTQPTDT